MGVMGLFLLGSCNSKSGDGHEGHNHETEKHEHEGCDHDHEGEDHNHEGDEHNHDGHSHDEHSHDEQTAAGHSDEIILPTAKAQAAGVKSNVVEPCRADVLYGTSFAIVTIMVYSR